MNYYLHLWLFNLIWEYWHCPTPVPTRSIPSARLVVNTLFYNMTKRTAGIQNTAVAPIGLCIVDLRFIHVCSLAVCMWGLEGAALQGLRLSAVDHISFTSQVNHMASFQILM